jgi:hypothetical protein
VGARLALRSDYLNGSQVESVSGEGRKKINSITHEDCEA